MNRFWDTADAVPGQSGWSVRLDGKTLKIPESGPLILPTAALAEAVAQEWRVAAGGVRGGETSWEQLPLTRLAGTMQERVARDPGPVALAIARYAESDLLCYRATGPDVLVRRQAAAWDPWLGWVLRTHGARLRSVAGVMPAIQDAGALAAIAAAVAAQPLAVLAGLGLAVPALGSAVLGLALADGALDADAAYGLSMLDEDFQIERWGSDAEALIRAERVRAEVALAARFMALARA